MAEPASLGRSGRRWEALKAQVFAEETHCWVCHRWVDQGLHHWHRLSRTVDHIKQLVDGGHPLDRANCRLAHRACNTARSNRLRGKANTSPFLSVDLGRI